MKSRTRNADRRRLAPKRGLNIQRRARLLIAAAAAVALAACMGTSLEPLALQISVSAPATAAVGDTVHFATQMQGNDLVGVSADYGDDAGDALALGFSRTAKTTFAHVYTAAGTYTTTVVVFQADSAHKAATATVEVH